MRSNFLRWLRPREQRSTQLGERGIALLMVMTLVVMFTAMVADFSYQSRVRYIMASRDRDAAKAEALAISGLRLYQLLLLFGDGAQDKLAKSPLASGLGMLMGSGSMVVRMIPCLDTGMLRLLTGAPMAMEGEAEGNPSGSTNTALGEAKAPTKVEDSASAPAGSFLDFDGDFMICAKEEGTKISLSSLSNKQLTDPGPLLLIQGLKKEENEPLFREANITVEELVSNIIDWIDLNTERANRQGYEDNLYNKLEEPYLSKNNKLDTISELHLIAGMTDEIFELIAPLVSVYTESDKVELPLSDPNMLGALLRAALPSNRFTDDDIQKIWTDYQAAGFTSLMPPETAKALCDALRSVSNQVSSLTPEALEPFVGKPNKRQKVYTLTSVGRVGEVERTLQVVINTAASRPMGGDIYYWRLE